MAQGCFNINIGLLGHVDSGKTSLARALSTTFSTSSLDKSKQSKERGITLDLGFSSFVLDEVPDHLREQIWSFRRDKIQFTLVDCPGHASLIKTIIGGAQIIDLMLLIIDVNKGIQTQTAECMVIAEILVDQLIVVLNKCDLIPEKEREARIEKEKKKLRKVFKKTKFGKKVTMVTVIANRGGQDAPGQAAGMTVEAIKGKADVAGLMETLVNTIRIPDRKALAAKPFLFAVDHCFAIKGQGTVVTGTVLGGQVELGSQIEVAGKGMTGKVKSMQMFRKPVEAAIAGDRVALCVSGWDPKRIERAVICSEGAVRTLDRAVARVDKIKYHKEPIQTGRKYHITVGHTTTVATIHCFRIPSAEERRAHGSRPKPQPAGADDEKTELDIAATSEGLPPFDWDEDYLHIEQLDENAPGGSQFMLLTFEKPIIVSGNALLIGSRLETDIEAKVIRLAFKGRIVADMNMDSAVLEKLRVYKPKVREGTVDRISDEYTIVGTDMFTKETDLSVFTGMTVELETGEVGQIEGGFGKTGKYKCGFRGGLSPELMSCKKKEKGSKKRMTRQIKVYLKFKKYIFSTNKKLMAQD